MYFGHRESGQILIDAGLDGTKEMVGGIWADELKPCIVCAGGRIDGWVGGKGAFLNLCVPYFFLGAARGW